MTWSRTRARCSCKFGVKKFQREQLRNLKYHGCQKLQCNPCAADAKDRARELRKKLQSSKRKCTCRFRIHAGKCPLIPVIFGEKRWPGSDGAISAEDRKFLDELNPPPDWWGKVRGR